MTLHLFFYTQKALEVVVGKILRLPLRNLDIPPETHIVSELSQTSTADDRVEETPWGLRLKAWKRHSQRASYNFIVDILSISARWKPEQNKQSGGGGGHYVQRVIGQSCTLKGLYPKGSIDLLPEIHNSLSLTLYRRCKRFLYYPLKKNCHVANPIPTGWPWDSNFIQQIRYQSDTGLSFFF